VIWDLGRSERCLLISKSSHFPVELIRGIRGRAGPSIRQESLSTAMRSACNIERSSECELKLTVSVLKLKVYDRYHEKTEVV
jgi:hypothetical protein